METVTIGYLIPDEQTTLVVLATLSNKKAHAHDSSFEAMAEAVRCMWQGTIGDDYVVFVWYRDDAPQTVDIDAEDIPT